MSSINKKKLFVISDKCNGCRICELRCSFSHYQIFGPSYARIRVEIDDENGLFSPHLCRSCKKPVCVNVCPEHALSVNPSNGSIVVDKDKCVGCGICVDNCPFEVMYLHPELNVAMTCDLCGGDPQCVKYCPEGALIYTTPKEFIQLKSKLR